MLDRAWAHRRFEAWRRRYPNLACRVRNTLELGPWYFDRLQKRRQTAEAYDAAFWDFHETGDWAGFAAVLIRLFPLASSVVDMGCGQGSALAGLAAVAPHLSLKGFDDSPTAVVRARSRRLAVDRVDFVSLGRGEARALAGKIGSVDLMLCLEVAEHLPPWHAGKLLDLLTPARWLVFSAAHPNQGGILHVNERPAGYWAERLRARGFVHSPIDKDLRAAVARLDLAHWYKENIHVFEATASS